MTRNSTPTTKGNKAMSMNQETFRKHLLVVSLVLLCLTMALLHR
jgi:hypothetical protein